MASFEIGTTYETMTNIESLATPLPVPQATYQDGMERVMLASGGVRWLGAPMATWIFPEMTEAQRDMLRSFCSGPSATVYVSTRTNASGSVFDDFVAVMLWPDAEEHKAGLVFDVQIKFQFLETV